MAIALQRITKQNIEFANKKILFECLTNQETKIIKLATEIYSNKEIAQILFLSVGTIKTHRENAYSKLEIHRKEEVRMFLRWAKSNIF